MKFLYVSTNAEEVRKLIDSAGLKNYQYKDLLSETAKRIGFNPISSVSFNGSIPYKAIEAIAIELSNLGLFTAVESLGIVKKIFPKDMEMRNELLSLAIKENYDLRRGYRKRDDTLKKEFRKAYSLLLYSNNPNQIIKK